MPLKLCSMESRQVPVKLCDMKARPIVTQAVQHEVTLTSSQVTGCSRCQTRPQQHTSLEVPPFGLQGSGGLQLW